MPSAARPPRTDPGTPGPKLQPRAGHANLLLVAIRPCLFLLRDGPPLLQLDELGDTGHAFLADGEEYVVPWNRETWHRWALNDQRASVYLLMP